MGKNKRKKTAHDKAIDELEKIVQDKYQITRKNVPYYKPPYSKSEAGEIDLLGICDQNWDIYEVKTGDDYKKAVKQLERARRLLSGCGNIKTFYYSAEEKKIKRVK